MPGLIGGVVGEETLRRMKAATYRREHHGTDLRSGVGLGLIHHGDTDPQGWCVNDGENGVGMVYGVAPTTDEWVDEMLDRPTEFLASIDGPFLIACREHATERFLLASDKLGSRPAYFTTEDTFAFASELKALRPVLKQVSLNPHTIADLVSMAHVWGEKTLLEGVHSLPPATVVSYEDDRLSMERYWEFSFESGRADRYSARLASIYEESLAELARTVEGNLGLWLSGGLDSRTMAMALDRQDIAFDTYSYNRPLERHSSIFKDDVSLAMEIAAALGVNNTTLTMTASKLRQRLPEVVEMTDGMVGWHTLTNLAAVFDLTSPSVDVLLEGASATVLCGEKVPVESLRTDRSAETELYHLLHRVDEDVVQGVLTADVTPRETFVEAVRESHMSTTPTQILDATNRNYYRGKHFMSDKITRGFFGTRQPFANGRLLDTISRMPPRYRRRMLPFTGGRIPHVPSLMKLELAREFSGRCDSIPYEATQLSPGRSHLLHGLGFVAKTAYEHLFVQQTIESWTAADDEFRAFFENSVRRASDLSVFDGDVVDRLRRSHFEGETDHFEALAAISTVDLFVEHVLDGSEN